MENRWAEYSATVTKIEEAGLDEKMSCNIVEPPDNFFKAFKYAEPDFYPNIKHLLIRYVSPISSTETERVASGFRRLKTPYCWTMSDEVKGDLTLIQFQNLTDVDENEVNKTFIQLHPRRRFTVKCTN